MAATMTTGLVLCLALWVLLWLLFGQGGRGAGTGESSRKGRGAVGEGTGEGPQKASAPTREDGQDESVGDVAGQGLGDPISDASNTESPPPQTHVGEKPPEDAAPIAGTQKGKSRFSIGGSDFFGITADGNAFVYIIDCSGSMAGEKLSKAKAELLRSISGLEADKSFFVIFFSNTHYTMFYPESGHTQLILATTDNKERIRKWVESFSFSGGTMPDSAIQLALTMHPDSIFLLTDGAFADTAVRVARQFNPSKIPINTIGFQDLGGAVNLKQISSDSGGKYKYVP